MSHLVLASATGFAKRRAAAIKSLISIELDCSRATLHYQDKQKHKSSLRTTLLSICEILIDTNNKVGCFPDCRHSKSWVVHKYLMGSIKGDVSFGLVFPEKGGRLMTIIATEGITYTIGRSGNTSTHKQKSLCVEKRLL